MIEINIKGQWLPVIIAGADPTVPYSFIYVCWDEMKSEYVVIDKEDIQDLRASK